MLIHPNLSVQVALDVHHERIATAERWRTVAGTRPVPEEPATDPAENTRTSSVVPGPVAREQRAPDLAAWLTSVGDIVVQFPIAELDGNRRRAFGVLVAGLLDAAREGGADVMLHVRPDDPAVALLRMLGRLASYAAGGPLPVSWRRARMLRAALDALVDGSVVADVRLPASAAA